MKKILIGFFGILLSLGLLASPDLAAAQSPFEAAKNQACKGLEFDDASSGECDDSSGEKIDSTVAAVINIASLVVGVISVIMVIIGGMKYITSQGDSSGTAAAKNTVIYAVVGLIIVALAQVIVIFVINRSTPEPESAAPTSGRYCTGSPRVCYE